MNIKTLSIIATCVTIATNGASWANTGMYAMPSEYYDGLNAKLIHMGYHGVRVMDEATNRLVAFDYNGSELVLTAHPGNYTIISSTYVHLIDE
jgi:hypothetical protein